MFVGSGESLTLIWLDGFVLEFCYFNSVVICVLTWPLRRCVVLLNLIAKLMIVLLLFSF